MEIRFFPGGQRLEFQPPLTVLQAMQRLGLAADAPCGGNGQCGKCRVVADGRPVLACRTQADDGMQVILPGREEPAVLQSARHKPLKADPFSAKPCNLAIDIGTTTVCCQVLRSADGRALASCGALNSQQSFGADVVSRIRAAMGGAGAALTRAIRTQLRTLADRALAQAGYDWPDVGAICVVGNPCMQQLFLGLPVENLAQPPFSPALRQAAQAPAGAYFPGCQGLLLTVPDISGYLGGDTVAGILATGLHAGQETALLVDIGTNGEMALSHRGRLLCCATAAGPALEGAGICFGMRGAPGAIHRVWQEGGEVRCHVLGDAPARGICGSGLLDAVALLVKNGLVNKRGRLCRGEDAPAFAGHLCQWEGQRAFRLTDGVYLTQEDIRQVQLAKGAIAAGITLLAREQGIGLGDIRRVYLAGAFGSFLDPDSACAIGLLPAQLRGRIEAVGNAALEGCRRMVSSREEFELGAWVAESACGVDLAQIPEFPRCFAKKMEL